MRNCANKYSVLTNTYEPRRIVMTCINIMLEYIRKTTMPLLGLLVQIWLTKALIVQNDFVFIKE